MEFAKLFLRNLLEEISATETATETVTATASVIETVKETAPVRETVKETAPVIETETNILYFYADWCPYCNKIKNQMEKIKTDFDNTVINNNKVSIKFIDCSKKNKETAKLMTKFNITWFPTLLIDKKEPLKFSNTFSYNTVSTFINKEANFA